MTPLAQRRLISLVIPLAKVPGALKKRKRVGRGISAGQGKTCGRGTKGQLSRPGDACPPRFEGGRMPVIRQLPKLDGFTRKKKVVYHPVNIKALSQLPEEITEVSIDVLKRFGLCSKKDIPIKILGEGKINRPLKVVAHAFSESARNKIESAGGTCVVMRP